MQTFIGDIRLFAFPWTPSGWASCDGQLRTISGNVTLFALLGTSYGGNGSTTFGLPDLRDRTPRHTGPTTPLAARQGTEEVVLSQTHLPVHTHGLHASRRRAIDGSPVGFVPAAGLNEAYARPGGNLVVMQQGRVGVTGGSEAHSNLQPYKTLQYAICTGGAYPSPAGVMDSSGPIIGEIRMFAGDYPPFGWALCHGQELDTVHSGPLFDVIGTTYGGDGVSNYGLPDLRGRIPLHRGPLHPFTTIGGTEKVTLQHGQLPHHSHELAGTDSLATDTSPAGNMPALARSAIYAPAGAATTGTVTSAEAGGGQPHENMAPSLAINFIISLFGLWPDPA